jgi:[ribosomal protein S5]-alanine N-acetyltransferase
MMDVSTIRTERLLLRRFLPEDALALHAMFCDAEVMRYGSRPPHTEMAETEAVVAKTIAAGDAGEADFFAVLCDGELVGNAGIWRNDEVGFMFVRKVWGTGIAREAVAAVIDRARARGMQKLTADVDPGNVRSLAFLKRFGFAVTGEAKNTWQVGGVWVDSVYLELLLAKSE